RQAGTRLDESRVVEVPMRTSAMWVIGLLSALAGCSGVDNAADDAATSGDLHRCRNHRCSPPPQLVLDMAEHATPDQGQAGPVDLAQAPPADGGSAPPCVRSASAWSTTDDYGYKHFGNYIVGNDNWGGMPNQTTWANSEKCWGSTMPGATTDRG